MIERARPLVVSVAAKRGTRVLLLDQAAAAAAETVLLGVVEQQPSSNHSGERLRARARRKIRREEGAAATAAPKGGIQPSIDTSCAENGSVPGALLQLLCRLFRHREKMGWRCWSSRARARLLADASLSFVCGECRTSPDTTDLGNGILLPGTEFRCRVRPKDPKDRWNPLKWLTAFSSTY